jgi:hypothetical protein
VEACGLFQLFFEVLWDVFSHGSGIKQVCS